MKKKNNNRKKQRSGQNRAKTGNSLVKNRPAPALPSQSQELEEAVPGAVMLEKSALDPVLKPECFTADEIIFVSWWKARFLVVNGSRRSMVLLGMVLVFLLLVLVIVAVVWHK